MREYHGETVAAPVAERVLMRLRVDERGALFAVSALLVLIPFFVVSIPPITDLPQHLAQIRLFGDALANPSGVYRVQWWTPYGLSYALLGLCRAIAPPMLAGRLALAIIAVLWVVTAHVLAASRGRSPLAAVLASLFVFCNVIYWGFLSFAVGWPIFAAWMVLSAREMRRPREAVLLAAIGLALYLCHALWLIAGIAWLGVVTIADAIRAVRQHSLKPRVQPMLLRACAAAPALVALALWTRGFQASDVQAPPVWITDPLSRLEARWLVEAALGGLHGSLEWLLASIVAAWLLIGLVQNWQRLRDAVDVPLLLGGALLGLFALLLPDKYMHTIRLAERWMPSAAILIILGMPAPRLRPVLLRVVVAGFAGAFVLATAMTWVAFERRELSGLGEALERLPPNPRVLGLDYQQKSELVRGRPFLQTYAWAQVFKGGTLNFSFASFPTSLVVFRSERPSPWTPQLYWYPRRLQPTDLAYFDYVIVNALREAHRDVVATWPLVPMTTVGNWRLYRVDHSTPGSWAKRGIGDRSAVAAGTGDSRSGVDDGTRTHDSRNHNPGL